jgi:hypothetical protein
MNLVEALADRALRVAVRRWPVALREEQGREWAAELDALRHDPELSAVRRGYAQLRFAASLAWSRPVEDAGGAPPAWTAVLPGVRASFRPMTVLLVAPFVGSFALTTASGLLHLAGNALQGLGPLDTGVPDTGEPGVAEQLVVAVVTVLLVVVAGWLGWLAGGRAPLAATAPRPIRIGLVSVTAPVLFGAGTAATVALTGVAENMPEAMSVALAGVGCWSVLVALVALVAVRFASAGRPGAVVVAAVLGGVLAGEISVVVLGLLASTGATPDPLTATLWFPAALVDRAGWVTPKGPSPGWEWMVGEVGAMPRTLLTGTAFVLPYAVRAGAR